jgi:multidrug efflux system membrane fusion protein
MSVKTSSTLETEEADLERSPDAEYPESEYPRPRPGGKARSLLWLIALAALAAGAYWLYVRWHNAQAAAAAKQATPGSQTIPVSTAAAQRGDIPVYLNGLGAVTAFNTVNVKTRVDGQLLSIAFKEGEFAKEGAPLAELDPRPFEVQLAQAKAQLAKDQATLANAQVDLARYRLLAEKGVIPSQQLDTQAATVRSDQAVIEADNAQIANAQLQLVYCHIKAPISGRIGLRQVDVGNIVHANDPNGIITITQVQPIAVLFTIPEDSLAQVLKRLRAGEHPPVEAYDRSGQNKIASGKLLTLDNQIDPTTGTSRLKAVFDNKDSSLFPNQFVNVRLLVETKQSQIIIPAVAVQRGPQGTFVYIVQADQTVDIRPVTAGVTEGSQTAIETGLKDGEQVVVDGVDKLKAGSKVQTSPAASPGSSPVLGQGQ